MDESVIADFLQTRQFAVFGASDKPNSEGLKIVQRLVKAGFQTFPVNPRIAKIGSMRCYGNLDEVPVTPMVVLVKLQPDYTLEVLRSSVAHGVRRFWIEPGSDSDDVLTYISEHGLSAVTGVSIVERLAAGKKS